MTEFRSLIEWNRPSYVAVLNVCRDRDQGIATVAVSLNSDDRDIGFELIGLNDYDSLGSLLESERIVISEEIGCQREFGSIRVECFNDGCYSEYWCDKYRERT